MKMKKIISAVTALAMSISVFGVSVFAETNVQSSKSDIVMEEVSLFKSDAVVKSGTCGANATWSLFANGTLSIDGSGVMEDYTKESAQPWYRNPNKITDDPEIIRVIVGSGITKIGDYSFSNIKTLESVSLADGGALNTIGEKAFYNSYNISEINFPYGLTKIEYNAFYNCKSLKEIVLPDSLSYVGSAAFDSCTSLEKITIPVVNVNYNINGYYTYPFVNCSSLKYCTLTGTGEMKGSNYSPIQETNITTLTISDKITSLYGSLAYNCKYLNTVTIPDGITRIPNYCFYGCSLESISFPDSVITIGTSAFSSLYGDGIGDGTNKFSLVILPEAITSISEKAFAGCNNLSSIFIPKSLTDIGDNAFYGCNQLKHIHIPEGRTALQYVNTPLPSNESYYYHFSSDGSCTSGIVCQIANEVIRKDKQKKVEAFVDRLYTIILGRHAESVGLADWTNRLMSGSASSAEIVYGIANSPEFGNLGLSNDEVIERMYQAMLGRGSDPSGKQNWLTAMSNGMTVTGIINGFSGSQEFANVCAGYGIKAGSITSCEPRDRNSGLTCFVARMYTEALGRSFDVDGLNTWTGAYLRGEQDARGIAYGFIFSQEFKNKNLNDNDYVEVLYKTFFGRASDEGGKAGWLNKLANGDSRESVLDGFLGSQEFANLKAGFGV